MTDTEQVKAFVYLQIDNIFGFYLFLIFLPDYMKTKDQIYTFPRIVHLCPPAIQEFF